MGVVHAENSFSLIRFELAFDRVTARAVGGRPQRHSRHCGALTRRHIRIVATLCVVIVFALAATIAAIAPEVLVAVDAIPAHLAGRFRESRGFSQAAAGHFLIFDRRAHTVFGIDEAMSAAYPIVEIGAEPGRILGPTAFGAAADGSFVVADAPRGQGRVQVFSPAGQLLQHFLLPGPARTRLMIDGFAGSGVAGLHYTGTSVLICQPEWGGLITEYSLLGQPLRTFGQLRATGHESDPDVHLALNSGLALAAPDGGYFFVFQAGRPVLRKYDAQGRLQFERQVQGREIDAVVASLPDRLAPRCRRAADDLPDRAGGGGRSEGTALDRPERSVHVRVRRGRRQGAGRPATRRRRALAEQPRVRQGWPPADDAGARDFRSGPRVEPAGRRDDSRAGDTAATNAVRRQQITCLPQSSLHQSGRLRISSGAARHLPKPGREGSPSAGGVTRPFEANLHDMPTSQTTSGLHCDVYSVQMRTTLNLDDARIARAAELTGLREKTALIHAGLDALIARASAQRLADLGGQFPTTTPGRRRRPRRAGR